MGKQNPSANQPLFTASRSCKRRLLRVMAVVGASLCSVSAMAQVAEPYRVNGIADIDAATCSQQGPTGSVLQQFWVLRRHDVAGPTQLALAGMPANVTASISPTTLTYPGSTLGQQITVVFTFNGGAAIPDSILQFNVSDAVGNAASHAITMHGTCPRHNKDFTIRGSFHSTHQGVTFPVAGALVEIYRSVPYWSDQHVGSASSADDGSFDVKFWTGAVDTYYAKLRLNDVAGVYLHEARTPEIKDYNSASRGDNSEPVIDVGATVIAREGGAGTPKSSVWQGGHWARQEFVKTFGRPAPIEDYEIVIENTDSDMNWTLRSKTHWEEGDPIYMFSTGAPTPASASDFDAYFSQFDNYGRIFHEFGHALRHTADGDDQHFFDDVVAFTLGQDHDLCTVSNPGHAFNEGWAEFWEMATGDNWQFNCVGANPANMSAEGAVMNDIYAVARAIDACNPAAGDRAERYKRQRRNMFNVLSLRVRSVHSEEDFRRRVQEDFPGCSLPPIGASVEISPRDVRLGIPNAKSTVATAGFLQARSSFYKAHASFLMEELSTLERSPRPRACRDPLCRDLAARVLGPIYVRAQIDYARLVARQLDLLHAQAVESRQRGPARSRSDTRSDTNRIARFDAEVRALVKATLERGQRALSSAAAADRSGSMKAELSAMRMASRRIALKTTNPLEVYAFFKLPAAPQDDQAVELRR